MGKRYCLRKALLIITILSISDLVVAQEPIIIGQKLSIDSNLLGESREYLVSLPESYSDSVFSEKEYPVCYFFDGDSHFENLVAQRNRLSSGLYASMPEIIMVGILQKDRTKELTPSAMGTPEEWKRADFSSSGGNGVFMEFIEKELKPMINSSYRTNSFEMLVGHSFGGLTVANALINHPADYDAYVAIDPSMWWDGEKLLSSLDSGWKADSYNGKIFFLAKADDPGSGEEHHNAILKFNKQLNALNQDSVLNYTYSFYAGEGHGSVVVPAEYDALRYIFDGYQLPVKQLMKQPELLDGHFEGVSEKLGYKVIPDEKMIDALAKVCERQELFEQTEELLRRNTVYYPESIHAQKRYKDYLIKKEGKE